MPLASVQIERTDSLELLPVAKAETKRYGHPSYTYLQYIYISIYRSPTHATIIGTLDPVDGRTVAKLSQVRRYHGLYLLYLRNVAPCQDPCNGSYYSYLHNYY